MILSPSVLSADFVDLKDQLDICAANGITHIHYDVMDGDFVPAISFGDTILKCIRKHYPDFFLDVHMMVTEPVRFLEAYKTAGADGFTVHYEACKHIDRSIQAIKAAGLKAGVALNPGTPVCMLQDILPEVDMVLIMSVNPGFGGQSFIPYALDKIKELDRIRRERGLHYTIQVDGGASAANAAGLVAAGVDDMVAGSAVFKGDIEKNIQAIYTAVNGGIKLC